MRMASGVGCTREVMRGFAAPHLQRGLAMRIATSLVAALLVLAFQPAYSATAQQEKMKTCNADAAAKHLAGDERKAFMKSCLSETGSAGGASHKELTPQQQKMSTCSKDAKAKGLKGDERKTFMSNCLKG
jgi:hypothetical protein